MVYGVFKGLNRKAAAAKVLRDKTLNIAKSTKYNLLQWSTNFLIDKTSAIKN